MDFTEQLTPIGSLFGLMLVIGSIVTSIIYAKAKAKTANADGIANAKDTAMKDMAISVEALRTQNGLQADQITKLDKTVTNLQGTVDTIKTIPLAKIEEHMADTSTHMANTNRLIEMLIPLIPQSVSIDTLTKTVTTNNRDVKTINKE
jgi:uncharacterized coiled-coil protein SlyX